MSCYQRSADFCAVREDCKIRAQQGGVLAILHPDFFQFCEESQVYDLPQVIKLINVFAFCYHVDCFLLDYGDVQASQRYPYNEKKHQADFLNNIRQAKTICIEGISGQFPNDAFVEALSVISTKYQDREVLILSPKPLENASLQVNGKTLYNLVPFSHQENGIIKQRIVQQSDKHGRPQYVNGETFCPIPEYMLTCFLERAIALDNNSFHDSSYNHLYSFIPEFNLPINYKHTEEKPLEMRDLAGCRPRIIADQRGGKVLIQQKKISYHAYQVSHQIENDKVWCKVVENGLAFGRTCPANDKEFIRLQKNMLEIIRPDITDGKRDIQSLLAPW